MVTSPAPDTATLLARLDDPTGWPAAAAALVAELGFRIVGEGIDPPDDGQILLHLSGQGIERVGVGRVDLRPRHAPYLRVEAQRLSRQRAAQRHLGATLVQQFSQTIHLPLTASAPPSQRCLRTARSSSLVFEM